VRLVCPQEIRRTLLPRKSPRPLPQKRPLQIKKEEKKLSADAKKKKIYITRKAPREKMEEHRFLFSFFVLFFSPSSSRIFFNSK